MNLRERLTGYWNSARSTWKSLPAVRRYAAVVAGVMVFALVLWSAWHAASPAYAPLYSGDYAAVAEVAKALDSKKIPYRLDGGGTRVMVPADQLAKARLETLGRGVPGQGGAGYELLDRVQFGITESDRSLQHKRILEGELARTVASISGVASARVHIALPEKSPFVRENVPPTASVLVNMKPGAELNGGDVQAITNVVAAAVPGLTPEKVVVTDNKGRILRPDSNAAAEDLAKKIERSVVNVLEAAFGPGAAATVNVETDPVEEVITEETAGTPLTRSRQQETETYQGSGPVSGGVPGTGSNLPGYFAPSSSGGGQYNKQKTTENFDIPVTRRQVTKPANTVKRVSVAAVVPVPLSAEQQSQAAKLVAAAAGTDENSVVVVSAAPPEKKTAEPLQWWEKLPAPALVALAALLVAVLVVLAALLTRRARKAPSIAQPEAVPVVKSTAELLAGFVRKNPAAAANAVRAMMRERGEAE